MTLTSRVIRGPDALTRAGAPFGELLRAVHAPVTARVPWMTTWARHHDDEPLLVVVEDGDRLVAAAPLASSRRRGRTRVVVLGHGESDRSCLPALDADAARALADAIATEARSWKRPWRLLIEQLPVGDAVAQALVSTLPFAEVRPGAPCPMLRFDRGREPELYETKSMRKQVRQARNRLETDGRTLAIDHLSDAASVIAALDELIELHRARDHALGRRSQLDDEEGLAVWRELVVTHVERGELELARMMVDGELAAYEIALIDPPRYTVWDHRIGVDYGRYFPGHVLARAQLDAVFTHEAVSTLDFGRGDEPYKQLMADVKDEREHLVAWSSSAARFAMETPRRARQRAAEFADRHPPVRKAWIWIKQHTVAR